MNDEGFQLTVKRNILKRLKALLFFLVIIFQVVIISANIINFSHLSMREFLSISGTYLLILLFIFFLFDFKLLIKINLARLFNKTLHDTDI